MTHQSKSGAVWAADPGVPLFRVDPRLPAGTVRHTTMALQGVKLRCADAATKELLAETVAVHLARRFKSSSPNGCSPRCGVAQHQ